MNNIVSFEQFNEKKGLWDRIHAKRKRGEKPAKPGDKDYPDQKQWKKLTESEVVNEGMLRRGLFKTIMASVIALVNLKSLITKGKIAVPFKAGKIMSNVTDFMMDIKKDPDVLDYYEGNYMDEYKKLHGTDITEDLNWVIDLLKKDLEKQTVELKKAKTRKMLDVLEELADACEDLKGLSDDSQGGGFIFNKKTGEKSYFQGRLNKLASGVYAGDISKK